MVKMKINGENFGTDELKIIYIRSSGPGGQNINKVNTAVMLKFDIFKSTFLDTEIKERLLSIKDARIDQQGMITILARRYRSQELNRLDAINRLVSLIRKASYCKPRRFPTRATTASMKRRIETKRKRGEIKKSRQKVSIDL